MDNYFRHKTPCGIRKLTLTFVSKIGVFSQFSRSLDFGAKMAEFPLPVLQIWRSWKRIAIQIQFMNIYVSECKYFCLRLVPKIGDVHDSQNQVEAETELRGWQGFRGWARIRSHAKKYLTNLIKKCWTCFRYQKLADFLVCFPPSVLGYYIFDSTTISTRVSTDGIIFWQISAFRLVRGAQTCHVGVPRCRRLWPSALEELRQIFRATFRQVFRGDFEQAPASHFRTHIFTSLCFNWQLSGGNISKEAGNIGYGFVGNE